MQVDCYMRWTMCRNRSFRHAFKSGMSYVVYYLRNRGAPFTWTTTVRLHNKVGSRFLLQCAALVSHKVVSIRGLPLLPFRRPLSSPDTRVLGHLRMNKECARVHTASVTPGLT